MQLESELSFCEACVQRKMLQLLHHPLKDIMSKEGLKLAYTDV